MSGVLYVISLIISFTAVSSYAEETLNNACSGTKNDPNCVLKADADTADTCYTEECNYTAAYILRNMNSSVDPCDDFYEFACGGFVKSTPIPHGETDVSIFTEMLKEIREQLNASLARSSTFDIRTISLAKNLYTACMDTATIENVGLKPILKILTELGSWPVLQGDNWKEHDFDWTRSVQKCRELGCEYNCFVAVDVIVDRLNIPVHVIDVEPPPLGLRVDDLITGLQNKTVQAYFDYMVDIAMMLGADQKTAVEQLTESLEFEIALAKLIASSETLEHNLITVADLQKLSPSIDWVDYLNNLLASSVTIDETERVLVNVPGYVSGLNDLLANTPKRVLANYFMFRVVDTLSVYSNSDLREREAMLDEVFSGEKETKERWETCLTVVREQLPVSIDALYVRNYYKKGTKEAVAELVATVKTELTQVIEKTKWMDDKSRIVALDKINHLISYIAYPEELFDDTTLNAFYANVEIDTAGYLESILNTIRFGKDYSFAKLGTPVNENFWVTHSEAAQAFAYYNVYQNGLHLPAGILKNLLFGLNRPAYVNLAFIGSIIINQMTYAVNDLGSQYDKNGILLANSWWSAETKARYQKNADCVIEQYNGYTVDSLGLPVNGSRTVQRNMADNSGVTVAYLAYKQFAEKYDSELKLEGLSYTREQLFWISTANIWCSKYLPDVLKTYVESNTGSPDEFRVIGPLANRPEFAEAFNCPVGSRMNPEHKCSVW